jgi:hypothetical protein
MNDNVNIDSTIAVSVNDNVNMDSTIAVSVNDNVNMDSTIAVSVNDNVNMDSVDIVVIVDHHCLTFFLIINTTFNNISVLLVIWIFFLLCLRVMSISTT